MTTTQTAPRRKRAGRKKSIRLNLPPALLIMIIALAVGLIVASVSLIGANAGLSALAAEKTREKEAYDALVYRHTVRYRDLIEEYAALYSLDPAYVAAIILRESSYDPTAVSSAGARGLMQVMEGTGEWIAGKLKMENYTFDALFDPETAIHFGCWYLKFLSDMFDGDPVRVACAYHAGQNNVKSWINSASEKGSALTLDTIPMEDTKSYATKVVNAFAVYAQNVYTAD